MDESHPVGFIDEKDLVGKVGGVARGTEDLNGLDGVTVVLSSGDQGTDYDFTNYYLPLG